MYKVKLYNKISDNGLSHFPKDEFSYSSDMTDYEGILVRSANLDIDEISKDTLAIARAGAGVNNIPVDAATQQGIVVFNTPGANANAVKEMVVAALYMSSRNVSNAIAWMDTIKDRGDEIPKLVEEGKAQFVGPEVMGKAIGIIGLGAVGVLVANVAVNLGLTVYGYDPYLLIDRALELNPEVIVLKDINELYSKSDYITIHIPLLKDTHSFINKTAIEKMKEGVRILNFARGELVDNLDILEAIKTEKVSCYITDFPNKHLIGQKGVVNIPHLGASTPESEENCAEMAVQELVNYLKTASIVNSVNFPPLELPGSFTARISIFSKENLLSVITEMASEEGYIVENTASSINKATSITYSVIDLNKKPEQDFIERLGGFNSIIRIRVIE